MMERIAQASPRLVARLAGAFYFLMVVSGGLGMLARGGLVVAGDAVATSTRILAHEPLWRLGFAADLFVVAFYLVVTALFYDLFRPVNRNVAFLGALFSLTGCTIQGFACLFQLAPLAVLGGAKYLSAFNTEQLQSLAYLFIKLYNLTYGIALVFFGFCGLLTGYLVFKSTFLPRILGVLMVIAGAAWLSFLAPAFGTKYLPYIMAAGIGEGLLTLWLLVFGVNAQRWKEQAGGVGAPIGT